MYFRLKFYKTDQPQQDFVFGCGVVGFVGGVTVDFSAWILGVVACTAGFALPPQQPESFILGSVDIKYLSRLSYERFAISIPSLAERKDIPLLIVRQNIVFHISYTC